MGKTIRKAAVIGAGVMGSGIAAHLANVGVKVYLLDVVPSELTEEERSKGWTLEESRFRNRLALQGIEKAKKNQAFYTLSSAASITAGNTSDHMHWLSQVDWIVEAVVENLAVKQTLLGEVEKFWQHGTVVSSNTSGVSIEKMAVDRSEEFRRHFLGTHFFNPPRVMKLMEIAPGSMTDPEIVEFMIRFSEDTLGKGVVLAKDTPSFIANRIGVYAFMVTLHKMLELRMSPELVDALTGSVIGHPKSATFRTLDLVGIDTFAYVAKNVYESLSDVMEKQYFVVPEFIWQMIKNGWTGRKAKQGFYRKVNQSGENVYQVLDLPNLSYREQGKARFASLESAKNAKSLPERLRILVNHEDEAGGFTWETLKRTLLYAAAKIPEISERIVDVDRAMKWGFNWEMGPFEMWDAMGLVETVHRMKNEGEQIAGWVENWLAQGHTSFYERKGEQTVCANSQGVPEIFLSPPKKVSLALLKEKKKVILENSGARLLDLGNDVACLEFHSPNNAIGPDIVAMVRQAANEVERNYRGMVIGNQSKHFCVGANLMLILMEAQDENWDVIGDFVKNFQDAMMRLKYLSRPVVAAPHAMSLGGGAEICFPAVKVQAAAETYMGLVEVGVGLIPAGGGTKEVLLRHVEAVQGHLTVDLQPLLNQAFEVIAMAKTSTSAAHAKELGYLRGTDGVSINRDHLIYDAKQRVMELSQAGYRPPLEQKIRVLGEPGAAVLKMMVYSMLLAGYISEHDARIANKLAEVMTGGKLPANVWVSEQYLLDLEREAFLSLAGEPKTQERMQHMLLKGKPLRN